MSSPLHKTRTDSAVRLGLALLAYMSVVTLIITLLPFQLAWPERFNVNLTGDALDIVANVVLFVPLGFLYRLAAPHRWSTFPAVLCVGAAASVAIETVQLFEYAREATFTDVAANTCGMGLGATAFARIARLPRVGGRLIDWLALELPLMALTYLMVPLLWINTLAAGGERLRLAATLLIGAFGAAIVGGVQRSYLGPSGAARPRHTATFVAIWFVAGAFVLLRSEPLALVAGTVASSALCWWLGARPSPTGPNRRFEVSLLRSAAPLYAAYLVLIVAAPLAPGPGEWNFRLGFADGMSDRVEILRLLELGAAFTLVGYMVAEVRGRAPMPPADAFLRLLAWGTGLAVAVEVVRGYHPGFGASLTRGALLAGATVYGGWLYYLQRAHVVQHLSRTPQPPSFPTMR